MMSPIASTTISADPYPTYTTTTHTKPLQMVTTSRSPFAPSSPLSPPHTPEAYIRPKLSARMPEARKEESEEEYEEDEEDIEMRRYLGQKAPPKKESLMDLLNSAPPGWKEEDDLPQPPPSPTASMGSRSAKLGKSPSVLSRTKFSLRNIRSKGSSTAISSSDNNSNNSQPLRGSKSSNSLANRFGSSSKSSLPPDNFLADLPPMPARKLQTKDAAAERTSTADLAAFLASSGPPPGMPVRNQGSLPKPAVAADELGRSSEPRRRSATLGHLSSNSVASVSRMQEALKAANTASLKKLSKTPLSAYAHYDIPQHDNLSVRATAGGASSSTGSSPSSSPLPYTVDETEVIHINKYRNEAAAQRKLSPVRPGTASSFGLDDWSDAVSQLDDHSPQHSPRALLLNRQASLASSHSATSPGLSPSGARRTSRKPIPEEGSTTTSSSASPTTTNASLREMRDRPFMNASTMSALQALQSAPVPATKKSPLLDLSPRPSTATGVPSSSVESASRLVDRRASQQTFGPAAQDSPPLREDRQRSTSRGVSRTRPTSVILAEFPATDGSNRSLSPERRRSRPLSLAPEEPLPKTPDEPSTVLLGAAAQLAAAERNAHPKRNSSLPPQSSPVVSSSDRDSSPTRKRNSTLGRLSLPPSSAAAPPATSKHSPAPSEDSFVDPPLVQVKSVHPPAVLEALTALQTAMKEVADTPLAGSEDSVTAIVPVLRGMQDQFEAAAELIKQVLLAVEVAQPATEPSAEGEEKAEEAVPAAEDDENEAEAEAAAETVPSLSVNERAISPQHDFKSSGMPGELTMEPDQTETETEDEEYEEGLSSDELESDTSIQTASLVVRSPPASPSITKRHSLPLTAMA